MTIDRNCAFIIIAAFAIGFYASSCSSSQPTPATERPVLRWIARAAKSLLWVALVAEKPPAEQPDHRLYQSPEIGADGYQIVDHSRGW
jgi:hypothetical protein